MAVLRGILFLLGAGLLLALSQAPAASHRTTAALPYADQPLPAHTGGFGEPTCRQCHFGGELNPPEGALALEGVPEAYAPGETYRITVALTRAEMQRAGFQLAARFTEGARAGKQAGTLAPADTQRATITAEESIQYAHHTPRGTDLSGNGAAQWTLTWTAPDTAAAPVAFHVAANAANDDASAFGDFIYAREARSRTSSD